MLDVASEVAQALAEGRGVVALESTLIAHGLPWPDNLMTARAMERAVRDAGATPATVAVVRGRLKVGLTDDELHRLAAERGWAKVSVRDLPVAVAMGQDGATTVASTLIVARMAGIGVMATGGIGGVHRGALGGARPSADVSADLVALARTPAVVVASGAKAVLDLPATREWLETHGVTVVGYRTDDFPGFYTERTGLPVDVRVETPEQVAAIARARREMGLEGAILVVNPPPRALALPPEQVEAHLAAAEEAMREQGVRGRDVTPFLLRRLQEATGGLAVRLNRALAESNAALAGAVAKALAGPEAHAR